MNNDSAKAAGESWDTYWQGAKSTEALASGGFTHPGFPLFWSKVFAEFFAISEGQDRRILDIGTGGGAVIEALLRHPQASAKNVTCVDVSKAAIDSVCERFAGIKGIVSDAADIPLDNGSIDLVTSQFGVEYAGPAAMDEAQRLLAPGGSLLFLLHIQSGSLYRECSAAVKALSRVRESGFIDLARAYFTAGFATLQGGDRADYEAAAAALNPALQELDAILTEHGEHVAGDTVVTLYDTVEKIHSRLQHHDPAEVMSWLDAMQHELPLHESRMQSMCDAALDEDGFKNLCEKLSKQGMLIRRAQPSMVEGEALPIAWILQAQGAE